MHQHTMTWKSILLAGLSTLITAQFSFSQNAPTPTATVEPNPIKSFKELVARFPTRSIAATKSAYVVDIMNVTFDVKKTDSLMNPVIGIINFTTKETHEYPLKYQKEFGQRSMRPIYMQMQMVFHWEGDHWKFERIWNRENGVDFTGGEKWGGPMSDFLKSVQ
jgi:hypothetical protein